MTTAEVLKNFRTVGKKIVAVARNYRAHAAELNNPVPKSPVFFMKATTSYLEPGKPFRIPKGSQNTAFEVELAVIIGKATVAGAVTKANAMEHVAGYALALDMTARDWQEAAKAEGLPWFVAKSFDNSCPITDAVERSALPAGAQGVPIRLELNGQIKQQSNTDKMIFDVPTLLSTISQHVTLEPGDLLLTGTPEGVDRVSPGDVIKCAVGQNDLLKLNVNVE